MITSVVKRDATLAARQFDTSILAGQKSPNTIEQYQRHFRAYCEYAGTFAEAMQPATLARWRQSLYNRVIVSRMAHSATIAFLQSTCDFLRSRRRLQKPHSKAMSAMSWQNNSSM